jgi:hypothetical protein
MATQVPLGELEGLPPELVATLGQAGYAMLNDILDLEREDIGAIAGMSPELADQLMAFLTELTEEGADEPAAATPAASPVAESVAESVAEPMAEAAPSSADPEETGVEPAAGGAERAPE